MFFNVCELLEIINHLLDISQMFIVDSATLNISLKLTEQDKLIANVPEPAKNSELR